MFVLCFEKGKFDDGFQTTIQTYKNLLNNDDKFWSNMIAVVTKVGWSEDHDCIEDWKKEMYDYKVNLQKEFQQRFGSKAYPTIVVISQDISRPGRTENRPNTEQNKIMVESMNYVYEMTRNNFHRG